MAESGQTYGTTMIKFLIYTAFQSRAPTNARSCKHLKALLGEAYEDERIKWKDPDGFAQRSGGKGSAKGRPASKLKPASKSKNKPPSRGAGSKRKKGDDNDDEDDGDEGRAGKRRKGDDIIDEDEESDDAIHSKIKVEVLLANKWDVDTGPDPTNWWISEKLDGVRYVGISIAI